MKPYDPQELYDLRINKRYPIYSIATYYKVNRETARKWCQAEGLAKKNPSTPLPKPSNLENGAMELVQKYLQMKLVS